jgi:hypothetical protein
VGNNEEQHRKRRCLRGQVRVNLHHVISHPYSINSISSK